MKATAARFVSIAKKYQGRGLGALLDLVQREGSLGLERRRGKIF